MPIIRINQLPDGSGSLSSDDILLFMDDPSGTGVTKKISISEVSGLIGGGGGGNPFDQSLNTSDSPTFNEITISGHPLNFGQNMDTLGAPVAGGATDRIRLWDFEGGGSNFNYAIGAEGNHVWFSMDVNNGTGGFKFYSRDNEILKISDDSKIVFPNTTTLAQGTFDNSTGGSSGISLNCVVGYELNWQGGHLKSTIDNGVTASTIICDSPISINNVLVSGNAISSIDANGSIFLIPNGDGSIIGGNGSLVGSAISTVVCGGVDNEIEDGANHSCIVGGQSNTIKEGTSSNDAPSHSIIGGGYSNEITSTSSSAADYSVICGGNDNIIYETNNSVIAGGANNDIGDAGHYSSIGGGSYNTVRTGYYTTIPGGLEAKTKDRAEFAYANGKFTDVGDAQYSMYVLKNTTSSSGWNSLYLDYNTNSDDTITIDSTTATFAINISGRSSGDSAGFIIRGCVKNISGTVSLVGSPIIESFLDSNFATANVQILTGGTGLVIQVDQGSSGVSGTVYWVATVQMSRVT